MGDEELEESILDNFTMESVHMYKNQNQDGVFYVDGYPIGEMEICLRHIIESLKITDQELLEITPEIDAFISDKRAYVGSDRAWNCVISLDVIKQLAR